MFPIPAEFSGGGVSRPVHGRREIQCRKFLGIRERADAEAADVYFNAASFEEAILATSVLGFSFCNCS
jgi:hypothetical protein